MRFFFYGFDLIAIFTRRPDIQLFAICVTLIYFLFSIFSFSKLLLLALFDVCFVCLYSFIFILVLLKIYFYSRSHFIQNVQCSCYFIIEIHRLHCVSYIITLSFCLVHHHHHFDLLIVSFLFRYFFFLLSFKLHLMKR